MMSTYSTERNGLVLEVEIFQELLCCKWLVVCSKTLELDTIFVRKLLE